MTVRVTKPEFNLRKKITELDKPTGLKGSELMTSDTAQDARELISASGRKNMIINGAMTINQRSGTSSYTIPHGTGGSYGGPDRWAVNEATDGSVSVNMDGDPAGANGDGYDVQEFTRAFQLACAGTASLSSSHNVHFFQNIEGYNMAHLGWGTMSAKPVTLSFWVKTNVTGVFAVGLENSTPDRCCIRDYKQKGDSKWNKVVLTFPGCTDGTWNTTNGCGMRVRFCLASGVQYDDGVDGVWVNSDELCTTTSQVVNFMDSTNNRFFITGVQLEVGKNATEFEHRSYGEELALCQRYFVKMYGSTGGLSTQDGGIATLANWTDTAAYGPIFMPVDMRTSPGLSGYSNLVYYSAGQTFTPSGNQVAATGSAVNRVELRINSMTSMSQGNAGWLRVNSTAGYIEFNSEL